MYIPCVERRMNQFAPSGRKTARSALPSPSKSAAAGMSPLAPNGAAKKLKSSLLSTYQEPLLGLQMAMSVFPSPVKSAGTGLSVPTPNADARMPAVERFSHQV